MWVIEGLDDGRWVLISETRRWMVDGVSATDLLSLILSQERESEEDEFEEDEFEEDEFEPWYASPEPSAASLIAHSLASRAA